MFKLDLKIIHYLADDINRMFRSILVSQWRLTAQWGSSIPRNKSESCFDTTYLSFSDYHIRNSVILVGNQQLFSLHHLYQFYLQNILHFIRLTSIFASYDINFAFYRGREAQGTPGPFLGCAYAVIWEDPSLCYHRRRQLIILKI